jgi:hypothetical protein
MNEAGVASSVTAAPALSARAPGGAPGRSRALRGAWDTGAKPMFAWLLLVAFYHNLTVVDQSIRISADNWWYLDLAERRSPELDWRNGPALVRASYVVEQGQPVRLLLTNRAGVEQIERGQAPVKLRQTALGPAGMLWERTGSPDDCFLVLDNRGSPAPSTVRVRVTVDSWDAPQLSSGRKLAVLAISFGVFFGMVGYSASKLWRVFTR